MQPNHEQYLKEGCHFFLFLLNWIIAGNSSFDWNTILQMLFWERDYSFKKFTICWVFMCWVSLGLFLHFAMLFGAG